jgi:hypothetical protein
MKLAKLIVAERDIEEDIKTMDFDQLADLVSKRVGVKVRFNVGTRNNRLVLESQDLSSKTGIQSDFYKEFKIANFGGNYSYNEEWYWVPLNFSWTYKKGGSNGTSLGDYHWNFKKGKWEEK